MAGGNKSNSPKARKRKVQTQQAAEKALQAKKGRWGNRRPASQ